jgi:hypothetical protein
MPKLRCFCTAAFTAVLLAGSTLAEEATGNVRIVDGASKTVTLESGEVFQLPPNYDDPQLGEPGVVAVITYEVKDGKNVATEIEVQKRK